MEIMPYESDIEKSYYSCRTLPMLVMKCQKGKKITVDPMSYPQFKCKNIELCRDILKERQKFSLYSPQKIVAWQALRAKRVIKLLWKLPIRILIWTSRNHILCFFSSYRDFSAIRGTTPQKLIPVKFYSNVSDPVK